jgi:hypothetical protein
MPNLALVSKSLVVIALLSVAGAGACSVPDARAANRNVNAAAESIQECEQKVAELRQSLGYVTALEQLVKARKVFLLKGSNGYMPVKVSDAADVLSGELLTGGITSQELGGILVGLRAQTAFELSYLQDDMNAASDKLYRTLDRCKSLKSGASTQASSTGSGDLTPAIAFQGVSEKRDEKTDAQTPSQGVTANVQSGSTYGGTVSVAGRVPTGDSIYVVFGPTILAVLGPGGGGFSGVTEPKGFGADTSLGAFVCKQGASVGQSITATSGCLVEGDDISVQWIA